MSDSSKSESVRKLLAYVIAAYGEYAADVIVDMGLLKDLSEADVMCVESELMHDAPHNVVSGYRDWMAKKLEEAVDAEDFEAAVELKNKLDSLESSNF